MNLAALLLGWWFAIARAEPIAITNVTVIDGTGTAPRPSVTVVIDGERITSSAMQSHRPARG